MNKTNCYIGCILFFFYPLQGQNSDPNLGLEYFDRLESYYSNLDSMSFYGEKAFFHLGESQYTEQAARSLLYVAMAKYWLGKNEASRKWVELALNYTLNHIGKENDIYNTSLNVLAAYYENIGDYENAKNIYEETIQNYKFHTNNDQQILSNYYTNLGLLHYSYGETAMSIACIQNAVRLVNNSKDATISTKADIQSNLGNAYFQDRNIKPAKSHYFKCLKLIIKSKNNYDIQIKIYAHQGLAKIYLTESKPDSVQYYLDQLFTIREKYGTQFQKDYNSDAIAAQFYAEQGETSQLDTFSNRAIQGARKWFKDFEKNGEVANMILEKAKLVHQYKSREEALDIYHEALVENSSDFDINDWQENPEHGQFFNPSYGLKIWTGKAKVLYELYQETREVQYLDEAIEVCELNTQLIFYIRDTYKAVQAKLFLSGQVVPFYELAILIALEKYQLTQQEDYMDLAFQYAESNKALLLLESRAKNKALLTSNLNSELVQREQSLAQKIIYYQKTVAESKQKKASPENTKQIEEYEALVFELKESQALALDSLNEFYPEVYAQDVSSSFMSATDLRKEILSSDEALLEFFVGEENIFVFLLKKGGIEVVKSQNITDLQEMVREVKGILQSPPKSQDFQSDYDQFVNTTHAIYQELLFPLLSKLPTKINQLTIVPDGFLSSIPFEILQTQSSLPQKANYKLDHLAYLMEDYQINYQYSANLIAEYAQKYTPKKELKLLASAPVFNSTTYVAERSCIGDDLSNLYCNQEEVKYIQGLLQGTTTYELENSATSFASKMLKYDILHLATHACLDTEDPKNTRIFFADGYLSAYDLSGIRFEPELIVLSACNTGAGKLQEGEGVFSLAREFTIAGSRSTLTSFWAIDDCSTSKVMNAYYTHLLDGASKDEAIQKAKMGFLQSADQETAHPYYWAAFLQFGDVAPLYNRSNYWRYIILALLLIGGGFVARSYLRTS